MDDKEILLEGDRLTDEITAVGISSTYIHLNQSATDLYFTLSHARDVANAMLKLCDEVEGKNAASEKIYIVTMGVEPLFVPSIHSWHKTLEDAKRATQSPEDIEWHETAQGWICNRFINEFNKETVFSISKSENKVTE